MGKLVLSDKQVIPTDKCISELLGDNLRFWESIVSHMGEHYPGSSGSWNYYQDGKQWLYKMVHKKKTIFWAAMHADSFRVTFYFGDKAETVIESSALRENVRKEFRTAKRYGKIRAITFRVTNDALVKQAFELIKIKSSLK